MRAPWQALRLSTLKGLAWHADMQACLMLASFGLNVPNLSTVHLLQFMQEANLNWPIRVSSHWGTLGAQYTLAARPTDHHHALNNG